MTATDESPKTYDLPVPDLSDEGLAEVTAEVAGHAADYDRTGEIPWRSLEVIHRAGLTTATVARQYGGPGLGTADVARANADGYTLFHGATYSIVVQPLTDKEAGYTFKSFVPICQTFKNDQVVLVPPNSPLKTARDLVEAAKRRPGQMNVGIPGIATIPHIAMIELERQAGIEFNLVPFKGTAEEVQNTRSGQLEFAAVPLTVASGSGLSMPGIFAETRNPAIPEVPTFKEQGYDIAPLSVGGLLGPAGMPPEVVRKLEVACIDIMKGEAAQRVVKSTFQPEGYFADAAGFARNLDADLAEKTPLAANLDLN